MTREGQGRRPMLAFLATTVAVAAFFGTPMTAAMTHNLRYYSRLSERGVATTATVTSTRPGNHNQVCYSFVAAGDRRSSCVTSDDYSTDTLHAGQTIGIIYDAGDPSRSCSCHDPAARLREQQGFALFVGLAILGFATLAGVMARRKVAGSSASVALRASRRT